uniref:protein-tyrosine-phosphatase n=1 Tax=Peronospora matthiolae TaxID=2874970 RepID=A0AAV1U473_9STRA
MAPNSPLVDLLVQRQHHHVALEGVPTAARIVDLLLFLGEARAAQDVAVLNANNSQAITALGTGYLTVKSCDVLLIDILDMEDELLLPHFNECIQFLNGFLTRQAAAALVHCVYGESRSAMICVTYMMATQEKTLLEAYDIVKRARPCISINTGFLRQPDLFERIQKDPNWMNCTPVHAKLRTTMALQQRVNTGAARIFNTVQPARSSGSVCCRKCTCVLSTTSIWVQLLHLSPGESSGGGGRCAGLSIQPMTLMTKDPVFIWHSVGKLLCPSCNA